MGVILYMNGQLLFIKWTMGTSSRLFSFDLVTGLEAETTILEVLSLAMFLQRLCPLSYDEVTEYKLWR